MSGEIILLDGCCCAGGAGYGYWQAAQELGKKITIVSVDINPQPNHCQMPGMQFVQDDLISFLDKNHKHFTHLHASPPCQQYSNSTAPSRNNGKMYRDILGEVVERFRKYPQPSVIENVPQAPIRPDIVLRGDMFGLGTLKRRYFELNNWFMLRPGVPIIKGSVKAGDYCTIVGKGNLTKKKTHTKYKQDQGNIKDNWRHASGNYWMKTYKELAESIPWKYTHYIGTQFFTI
jgi:DNA (cytosine-5)-methyltransferase 1